MQAAPLCATAVQNFKVLSLPAIESTEEAQFYLSSPLPGSGSISFQVVVTGTSGFEECYGQVSLAPDQQTLIFILNNPQGNPLPANATIAYIQVIDPDAQTQTNLVVETDGGGVMIIAVDM